MSSYQGDGYHNSAVCYIGKNVSYEMLLPYSERIHLLCLQGGGSGILRNVATNFPNYTQSQNRMLIYMYKDRKPLKIQ
jgi:hypothetical protein